MELLRKFSAGRRAKPQIYFSAVRAFRKKSKKKKDEEQDVP